METAQSNPPKRVTDAFECRCKTCGKAMYSETVVSELDAAGQYQHTKVVEGKFKQTCDPSGVPTGPVIPVCTCTGESNVQG